MKEGCIAHDSSNIGAVLDRYLSLFSLEQSYVGTGEATISNISLIGSTGA